MAHQGVSRRSQENLASQPSRRSRAGRCPFGVDASFMRLGVHGWDIHAVSAPGRRAPPVTRGQGVRWRITAAAPPGRPGPAAARPDDTNAASTAVGLDPVMRPRDLPGRVVEGLDPDVIVFATRYTSVKGARERGSRSCRRSPSLSANRISLAARPLHVPLGELPAPARGVERITKQLS